MIRGSLMRNVRCVRRYACRCETLVAMAFASSFYFYFKWRESKLSSSPAQAGNHFTGLSHFWQQYYRLLAAKQSPTTLSAIDTVDGDAIKNRSPISDIGSSKFFIAGMTDKAETSDDQNGPWSYKVDNIAVYALKGRRPTMEDRFNIVSDQHAANGTVGFAIYDGHGGPYVADFAERHILPSVLVKLLNDNKRVNNQNLTKILSEEIVSQDAQLMAEGGTHQDLSGSTALLGVLHQKKLYVANVGDCRAVANKAGTLDETLQITMDHKPNQERELTRIKKSGGWIAFNGVWRVGGILAVSRALGDGFLKKRGWLTAEPDVFVIDLQRLPIKYVIFASDGLWDVFSSQEAVEFISPLVNTEHLFGAKQLAEKAVKRGSTDNVTVMVVKLT